jgi:predicted DNA-binding protein YlxM (UPF0122 family)
MSSGYKPSSFKSTHCVLIGDIRQSSKLTDWNKVFRNLTKVLDKINQDFHDYTLVNFGPTVGDEFQGTIKTPEKAFDIYLFLKTRLQVPFYLGVGLGDVEKPLPNDTGMRGTAFYYARDALNMCKNNKVWIRIHSSKEPTLTDDIFNTLLFITELLENEWTPRGREVINYFRLHQDYSYEQVGQHFHISKQSVYKIVKSTHWKSLLSIEDLIKNLLKEVSINQSTPKGLLFKSNPI